jgi:hypothetical protein
MLIHFLLSTLAHAEDLQVHIAIPGAQPVWAVFQNVAVGSRHEAYFSVDRRSRYRLTAEVREPSDGFDWRVAFDLSADRSRGRGKVAEWELVLRPTMQAHTNELGQFTLGNTEPILDSDPIVYAFRGYTIDWVVTPAQAQ